MNNVNYRLLKVGQLPTDVVEGLTKDPIYLGDDSSYYIECADAERNVKYVKILPTEMVRVKTTKSDGTKTLGTGNDQLFCKLERRYFSCADLTAQEQAFLVREGWLVVSLNDDQCCNAKYILYRDANNSRIHITRVRDVVDSPRGVCCEREPFHFGRYDHDIFKPEQPQDSLEELKESARATDKQPTPLNPFGSVKSELLENSSISLTVTFYNKDVRLDGLNEKTALRAFKDVLELFTE